MMYLTRFLVLTLILAVTFRDDAGVFFNSISYASTLVSFRGSDGPASHGEQEDWWDNGDDEPDWSDEHPENDSFPAESGDLPGMLEIELDSEAEEMMYPGDHKAQLGFVIHCVFHEDNASSFASFTSFCTLKRLRT